LKLGPYELGSNDTPENGIYCGDARELAKAIPDEGVDLIFTDPPYPREYLPLWRWLGKEAARVLRPGGLCLAMSGQSYLPDVYSMMSESLEYHWTFLLQTPGQKCTIWPRKVSPGWKPVLSYSKGKYDGPWWGIDIMTSQMNDKRFHHWGQSESGVLAFLSRLPDGILWEPFCGGGSTVAVWGPMLNRRYFAFEVSSDSCEMARERVRNTQPPLFIPEPETQLQMI